MGLVHEDDVDWFLTLDETHHEFSTVGDLVISDPPGADDMSSDSRSTQQ